jgi:Mg-chelatase subunit ChlD
LRVVGADAGRPALEGATVAVVFDASGSMLQRIRGERRIDLAKQAVGTLVRDVLPFRLRRSTARPRLRRSLRLKP